MKQVKIFYSDSEIRSMKYCGASSRLQPRSSLRPPIFLLAATRFIQLARAQTVSPSRPSPLSTCLSTCNPVFMGGSMKSALVSFSEAAAHVPSAGVKFWDGVECMQGENKNPVESLLAEETMTMRVRIDPPNL